MIGIIYDKLYLGAVYSRHSVEGTEISLDNLQLCLSMLLHFRLFDQIAYPSVVC